MPTAQRTIYAYVKSKETKEGSPVFKKNRVQKTGKFFETRTAQVRGKLRLRDEP